jgi:drug/metabolite transporter (DMT)-like permease
MGSALDIGGSVYAAHARIAEPVSEPGAGGATLRFGRECALLQPSFPRSLPDVPLAGELFSLAAALIWAFAVILFRRSGETMPPFALNLYRVGVSSVLFLLLFAALGMPLFPERPWQDYLLLAASGAIGIVLSDTLFHRSLNIVGAGINAIVDCLYSPFVVLFAFVMLEETLDVWQLLGMALVIGAVIITTHAKPPEGTSPQQLIVGIFWGVMAMITLALGVVIAKPVLKDASVLWVTMMRQLASFAIMAPIALALRDRAAVWSVFRPTASWRFSLPGTVLGSFLALLCWLAGFKYTSAGVAAALNQTATIFILVLAALLLKEPFTLRRWIAAALAIGGILLVIFG